MKNKNIAIYELKIKSLSQQLKNLCIWCAVLIGAFIATLLCTAFIEETFVPFVIFLVVYMGGSLIASFTHSTIIKGLFSFQVNAGSGETGTFMGCLMVFLFPLISIVSCFLGTWIVVYKAFMVFSERQTLKNNLKKEQDKDSPTNRA